MSPGREPVKVTEGSEPAAFWDSLGGKTEYGSGQLCIHLKCTFRMVMYTHWMLSWRAIFICYIYQLFVDADNIHIT